MLSNEAPAFLAGSNIFMVRMRHLIAPPGLGSSPVVNQSPKRPGENSGFGR